MSTNKRTDGTGTFTLDGTDYGSKSGGPQPLAGLTGLNSGMNFSLQGPTSNVDQMSVNNNPVALSTNNLNGDNPLVIGSGNYAFNVNTDANGNITAPTSGGGNLGYGAPLDPSALGQSAQRNQTGSGRVSLKDVSFAPGILQQLNSGSSQGNNLIALLQKMKAGSAV
jgi:hypothetical protein